MNLQGAPTFSKEDYPDVSEELLERLTLAFDELYGGLQAQATRSPPIGGSFVSAASGVSTVELKNPLATKPQHVTLTLRRDDLADFAAAWSWWYQMASGVIRLSFVGLPASVKLVYSVEVL